ncbi:MAG: contractile injection system tape measure protein, partial [Duganella sp.]
MNARHHIADLHLDLSFESDDPRPRPVAEAALLALAQEHILPVLEQVLDQEDDGRWRHIGKLDIDLGACAAHDYAHEIPPLLARLLREALARHDSEAHRPLASSDISAVATHHALPGQHAPLDRPAALERFLRSGCLPALPVTNAIDGALRMSGQLLAPWLTAPDSTELAAMLERCAADDAAITLIRRLAQQFEPHTLRQLVQRLETPARATAWLAMVDAIEAALAPADGMQRQHLRQLWELVLQDIFASAAAVAQAPVRGLGATSMARFAMPAPLRQAAASVAARPDQVFPHTAALLRAIAAAPQVAPPQLPGQLQEHLQEQMQVMDRPDALAEMQAAATAPGAISAPDLLLSAPITQAIEARIEASFATANAAPIYADWDLLLHDHADLLRAALLRHGGVERLLDSFPASLLENLAALANAEAPDHGAGPSADYPHVYPAGSAAAIMPAHASVQQRWQLCLMHLASQRFDVERLRSALQTVQQVQTVQQAAAPALRINEGGLSSSSAGADGLTSAYGRIGPAAVPAQTPLMVEVADTAAAHILTADTSRARLSETAAPRMPAIADSATAWEDLERHIAALPGAERMREAVRTAADASADRQAFLHQVATALRAQQPLDLERIEEDIAVEQALANALRSADPAGIDAALAGASERDVLAAMRRIGDNAEVWSQLAHLEPALLMRLTMLASPAAGQLMRTLPSAHQLATPALPVDEVGDLSPTSASADGPTNAYDQVGQVGQAAALAQPPLLTAAADPTATDIATAKLAETPAWWMPAIADQATDWDDVAAHIAALPGAGLMRDAVRAAADASADRQAFLHQVATALRAQQPLDLEQIEENIGVEQALAD